MLTIFYTVLFILCSHILGMEKHFIFGIIMILTFIRVLKGLRVHPFYFIDFFYRKFSRNNLLELLAASLAILYYYVFKGYINSFPEIITFPFMTTFIYSTFFIDLESGFSKKLKENSGVEEVKTDG